jgi:glycosyltransferase involved in cell wall biosynthesis
MNINSSISFIIPAYNCSATIEESINSIVNGNIKDGDEIVICDDGSIDQTGNILKKISEKHSFIKIVKHEINSGGASARNTAVSNCVNDIIFCLDSDNILVPGSIEELKKFMIKNTADIAVFQELRFFKKNTNKISHKWIFPEGIFTLADHLSGHTCPGASGNYLFTKKSWVLANGYPTFSKSLDAWGFGFRQLATGSKMVIMPNSYYFHRYGHQSYWVRESKNNLSELAFLIIDQYNNLINSDDYNYIKNNDWFDCLAEKPIRLKKYSVGKTGRVEFCNKFEFMLKNFVKKLIKK